MSYEDLKIAQFISKYLLGELSEREKKELAEWVQREEMNRAFFEEVCCEDLWEDKIRLREELDVPKAMENFHSRIGQVSRRRFKKKIFYTVAGVAAVLIVGIVCYFLLPRTDQPAIPMTYSEIVPGTTKAVLTLANGQQMPLTGDDSVMIDVQAGVQALHNAGQLVYQGNEDEVSVYNELQVPRGGEYQLVLSDGSIVRLNSGSSLKYPVTFGKEKREVELTGEAYFEVARDAKRPFWVKTGGMRVKVYGTIFNINDHFPGHIQTVLVQGKIGISWGDPENERILQPSQLADLDIHTMEISVKNVDANSYIAWTKGQYIFNDMRLEELMNTLALWYDMEVFYQNEAVKDLHFTGMVRRYEKIDNILRALNQAVGIQFQCKNKTVIISK